MIWMVDKKQKRFTISFFHVDQLKMIWPMDFFFHFSSDAKKTLQNRYISSILLIDLKRQSENCTGLHLWKEDLYKTIWLLQSQILFYPYLSRPSWFNILLIDKDVFIYNEISRNSNKCELNKNYIIFQFWACGNIHICHFTDSKDQTPYLFYLKKIYKG